MWFIQGWQLAAVDQNCNAACSALNLECSEKIFLQKNADVDTSSEVINLIGALGGTVSGLPSACDNSHGTAADVPNYSASGSECFQSDSSRPLESINCAAVPTPVGSKQRLCVCNTPGKFPGLEGWGFQFPLLNISPSTNITLYVKQFFIHSSSIDTKLFIKAWPLFYSAIKKSQE